MDKVGACRETTGQVFDVELKEEVLKTETPEGEEEIGGVETRHKDGDKG